MTQRPVHGSTCALAQEGRSASHLKDIHALVSGPTAMNTGVEEVIRPQGLHVEIASKARAKR